MPSNASEAEQALRAMDTEEFRVRLGRIACGYDGGQVDPENAPGDPKQ